MLYISNSAKKAKESKKEFFIYNDILLLLQEKLPNIDISAVCKKVQKTIPKKLFKDLDYIYIGQFEELDAREVQSAYLRGAIYITSKNQTEDSIYNAIVHELAHSIESVFNELIYGDNEVAAEFISKRKKLRSILKTQNLEYEDPMFFLRQEYSPKFDEFLYKTVGYDRLSILTVGLFISPYAATSLREYFANGFEHYYNGDREYLEKISPKLSSKIFKLTKRSV